MRFMVHGTPKQALTDDIIALLPAETARGQELDASGLRVARYLAADNSMIWQVFEAASAEEVQGVLETLPLYHATAYTITSLADT
jgi:muconolactone delta-isomerase